MASLELKNIETIWPTVSSTFSVPHTKKDYEKLSKLMDEIVDEVKSDSKHPLESLMETIGILVSDFEEKHFKINNSSPVSVIKNLIA